METEMKKEKERNGTEPKKEAKKKERKAKKLAQAVMGGDILGQEDFIHLLPFVIFLTILGLIYISNTYYAEKTIRETNKIRKELKELRFEYISTKSDLMFKCQQSQVASKLINRGIREATVPPKKIFYTESELKHGE